MTKRKISFFLFFILFLSCISEDENIINFEKTIKEKKNILIKKNPYELMHMYNYYEINNKPIFELLPEAFYIAETNGYLFSYQLIYLGTLNKYFENHIDSKNHLYYFIKLPENEKNIVLRYLHKGAIKNDPVCIDFLIDIYKKLNKLSQFSKKNI